MASNFSSMWSPFVFKMLGGCESSFIKQRVILTYCTEFLVVLYLYFLLKETQTQKQEASQVLLEQIYNSLVG